MDNVNVINNVGKEINVVVNKNDDKIDIVIELAENNFKLPSSLKAGDVFKDNDGDEYILLYFLPNGDAVVLSKSYLKSMRFGDNNNYSGCNIDKYLCGEYLYELERKFGKDNIVKHEVNLLSLDGENDYGKIARKVSLLTLDEYRNNKKAIKNYINNWFWLCTPSSTNNGCGSDRVLFVNSNGDVSHIWHGGNKTIRPRFVLASSIFKS